jgi:hypothetical protein
MLDDEKSKTKSLTDRLNVLRAELNQTKSAQLAAQRMFEDVQVNPDLLFGAISPSING